MSNSYLLALKEYLDNNKRHCYFVPVRPANHVAHRNKDNNDNNDVYDLLYEFQCYLQKILKQIDPNIEKNFNRSPSRTFPDQLNYDSLPQYINPSSFFSFENRTWESFDAIALLKMLLRYRPTLKGVASSGIITTRNEWAHQQTSPGSTSFSFAYTHLTTVLTSIRIYVLFSSSKTSAGAEAAQVVHRSNEEPHKKGTQAGWMTCSDTEQGNLLTLAFSYYPSLIHFEVTIGFAMSHSTIFISSMFANSIVYESNKFTFFLIFCDTVFRRLASE